jgi:hypothetical protein
MAKLDFLNTPIKAGDFVVCLERNYKVLRIGVILQETEKTLLILPLEIDSKKLPSLKKQLENKGVFDRYCGGQTYRTSEECVIYITKDQIRVKRSQWSEEDYKSIQEIVDLYQTKNPIKGVKKAEKSKLKI